MKSLEIELGASFFEGTAETINNFFGSEVIGPRTVVAVVNEKRDKRVNFTIHNLDSDSSETKIIKSTQDLCAVEITKTNKRKEQTNG